MGIYTPHHPNPRLPRRRHRSPLLSRRRRRSIEESPARTPLTRQGRKHGGHEDGAGGDAPHPQVHDQPPPLPQAVRARGAPPGPRQRLQGGSEGEAGEAVRGEGLQLHLRVQVPHPLRRRQVHRIRPHLRQPRRRQEVRAQVQAHQEWPRYQGREVSQADEGEEEQSKEDPWSEEDKGWRCRQEEVSKGVELTYLSCLSRPLSIFVPLSASPCGLQNMD